MCHLFLLIALVWYTAIRFLFSFLLAPSLTSEQRAACLICWSSWILEQSFLFRCWNSMQRWNDGVTNSSCPSLSYFFQLNAHEIVLSARSLILNAMLESVLVVNGVKVVFLLLSFISWIFSGLIRRKFLLIILMKWWILFCNICMRTPSIQINSTRCWSLSKYSVVVKQSLFSPKYFRLLKISALRD